MPAIRGGDRPTRGPRRPRYGPRVPTFVVGFSPGGRNWTRFFAPRKQYTAGPDLTPCHGTTPYRCQRSGMPFSSCSPRSWKTSPDPATRSFTVGETRTSDGRAIPTDPRPDVHGDAADLPVDRLDLARVDPGANLEPEGPDGLDDRLAQRTARAGPSKRGEEAVSRGVDLDPVVAGQDRSDRRVVRLDESPAIAGRRARPPSPSIPRCP